MRTLSIRPLRPPYRRRSPFHPATYLAAALCTFAGAGCENSPADPPIVGPLSILARTRSIHVGDTLALVVLDDRGNQVDSSLIRWQIADAGVLELFDNVVVGVEEGTGTVTAAVEAERAGIDIDVSAPDAGWTNVGFICGSRSDLRVWCWERNEGVPAGALIALPESNVAGYFESGVQFTHSCILDAGERAKCRGYNFMGQLGTGDIEVHADFTPVATEVRFRSLSLGSTHTCGVSVEGEVWCWGAGGTGQLSTTATESSCRRTLPVGCALEPVRINLPEESIKVAAGGGVNQEGDGFTCALSGSGRVRCWGDNRMGQTAGPRDSLVVTAPHLVSETVLFRDLAAGNYHACAIDLAYQVWCWGLGNGGLGTSLPGGSEFECAEGDVIWACTFSAVPAGTGTHFRSITAGYNGSCGLSVLGQVFCWGDNRFGQVGTGQMSPDHDDNIWEPTPIASEETFVKVYSTSTSTCAITLLRAGVCWGGGSPVPSPIPEPPG